MYSWKKLFFVSLIFLNCLHAGWTSSPVTIDSGIASSAAPLVIDAQGNVTSAWLENYGGGDDPQAAFFSFASQQWMSPQNISVAGAGLTAPQLIVDPFGTVTLVWLEFFSENANSSTLFASRSTQGGAWTTPVPLNSLSIPTNAQVPISMIVDTQGNVTIVWLEQDISTSHYAIGSARFTSDITISPTLYSFLDGSSPNANNNVIPQLIVDQLGYVTAIWQESTGSGFAVQAARLDPSGSAWSTVVNLDGSSPNANSSITPRMVVDATGIVTVVWQESGSQFSVQAARFVPGMGGVGGSWTTYTSLAPALANANGTITPQIVVDNSGNVTIAAVDASLSVWPSSFAVNSSSWTYPASPLANGIAFILTSLSMVVDNSGVVTTVWINDVGGQLFVQAARGFSTSWSSAVTLDAGNADENTPLLVVVDSSDNVTVGWIEILNSGESAMQAARFVSETSSWTQAATLDDGNLYNLISPKMIIGPLGIVTAVWQEGPTLEGTYAVQGANFMPSQNSWTLSTTLDNGSQSPNAYYSSMTQQINMVVDAFNNVTVNWLETSTATSNNIVQAARFAAPPLPPSSITGKQVKKQHRSQTNIVNIIKWTPPTSGNPPVSYNVYRDSLNTLIGTVSASSPLRFEDPHRTKNVTYTYYVVSVDAAGDPSIPASVTISPIQHCCARI